MTMLTSLRGIICQTSRARLPSTMLKAKQTAVELGIGSCPDGTGATFPRLCSATALAVTAA